MMDLKKRGLPNYITDNDGDPLLLNTDYRVWLDFPQRMEEAIDGNEERYEELFEEYVPYLTQHIADELQNFYYVKPEIPRDLSENGEELIDYDIDADYIFSAFMQSYGIDLTEVSLHWHKFLALLSSLPEDTMLSKIMGYRSYSGNSKDPGYKDYMKLKSAWSLPTKHTEEEQKAIDEFNEMFG